MLFLETGEKKLPLDAIFFFFFFIKKSQKVMKNLKKSYFSGIVCEQYLNSRMLTFFYLSRKKACQVRKCHLDSTF